MRCADHRGPEAAVRAPERERVQKLGACASRERERERERAARNAASVMFEYMFAYNRDLLVYWFLVLSCASSVYSE